MRAQVDRGTRAAGGFLEPTTWHDSHRLPPHDHRQSLSGDDQGGPAHSALLAIKQVTRWGYTAPAAVKYLCGLAGFGL